jgi:hypothetical protein
MCVVDDVYYLFDIISANNFFITLKKELPKIYFGSKFDEFNINNYTTNIDEAVLISNFIKKRPLY